MLFPNPVDPLETLARFVLEWSKVRRSDNTVKYSAFVPAKDNVLSTYRTDDLTILEVFSLGKEYVGNPQGKDVIGSATIRADEFMRLGLRLRPTKDPHPRHVDVEGWGESAENRSKAQLLAGLARLTLQSMA